MPASPRAAIRTRSNATRLIGAWSFESSTAQRACRLPSLHVHIRVLKLLRAILESGLVLLDPARRRTVTASELQSRSRNTPYAGRTLPVTVVATFLRGRATVLDGAVVTAVHS